MLNNNTVSKYVDAITKEAQQAQADSEKKIADYKNAKTAAFKKSAKAESEREIMRRDSLIHEDIGRDFSSKEIALRKQIFTKRDEIKTAVFTKAAEKLCDFVNSADYKDFVIKSAESIKTNLVGRDKVITVYLRNEDMPLKSEIETAFNFPCDFVADDSIKIGGIKAKFSTVIIDDTLDARLNSQTDWFEENSGLDIK
mgnify:CR=1 FL=1